MTGEKEHPMMQETETIETVREYVVANTVAAKDGRKCVDGRYSTDTGEIARPGGDMGYVEVLLALNQEKGLGMTPRECFDLVYNYVTKNGGKFYMHTDHHADPEDDQETHIDQRPLIGCGHAAKAADPQLAEKYGVNPEEVAEVVRYAKSKYTEEKENQESTGEQNLTMEMVNLKGKHSERGTLVIIGKKNTVNSQDKNGEKMFFVYDQERDIENMRELVEGLHNPEITIEDFVRVSNQQTDATLELLAKGKPVFTVNADNPQEPEVAFVKNVA